MKSYNLLLLIRFPCVRFICMCLIYACFFTYTQNVISEEITGRKTDKIMTYTANLGYRAELSGPVVCTQKGKLLWAISAPGCLEAKHLAVLKLFESGDNGATWGRPSILVPANRESGVNTFSMTLLSSGKLLHIFARLMGDDHENYTDAFNEGYIHWSTDNGVSWSEPVKIPTGKHYLSNVLSCTQLSGGRIIFPFGYLKSNKKLYSSSVVWSDDEGRTWQRSKSILESGGGGAESGTIEPSVVELPDGRLWMLIRTQTGFQYESFSSDGGETWTEAHPSKFPSSNAPAVLLRLKSGRIIVVWNNCVHFGYARFSLVMAATDDGEHFFGFREIDNSDSPRVGSDVFWNVMYPYLCEGPDGHIFVSYNYGDWTYNEAKIARIDPSWLEETSIIENFSDGLGDWCAFRDINNYPRFDNLMLPEDNQPGSVLRIINIGKETSDGLTRNIPNVSRGEIKITASIEKPEGYILLNNSFLNPHSVEEAVLRVRCGKDGAVFIGAGTPEKIDRNAHNLYYYLGYPVKYEQRYPNTITPGKQFIMTIKYDADKQEARVSIDDGPVVKVKTGKVIGLCYIGLAAAGGGDFRIRRIVVSEDKI